MVNSSIKIIACYLSFCNVCCDHLELELVNVAERDIIGELLLLKNQDGRKKIQQFTSENDVMKCKRECHDYYKFQLPSVLPPPTRDPTLGKKANNPAKSCSDIIKWGEYIITKIKREIKKWTVLDCSRKRETRSIL